MQKYNHPPRTSVVLILAVIIAFLSASFSIKASSVNNFVISRWTQINVSLRGIGKQSQVLAVDSLHDLQLAVQNIQLIFSKYLPSVVAASSNKDIEVLRIGLLTTQNFEEQQRIIKVLKNYLETLNFKSEGEGVR